MSIRNLEKEEKNFIDYLEQKLQAENGAIVSRSLIPMLRNSRLSVVSLKEIWNKCFEVNDPNIKISRKDLIKMVRLISAAQSNENIDHIDLGIPRQIPKIAGYMSPSQSIWNLDPSTEEIDESLFQQHQSNGIINGNSAMEIFQRSGLDQAILANVFTLVKSKSPWQDGLNKRQFRLSLHLLRYYSRRTISEIPKELPDHVSEWVSALSASQSPVSTLPSSSFSLPRNISQLPLNSENGSSSSLSRENFKIDSEFRSRFERSFKELDKNNMGYLSSADVTSWLKQRQIDESSISKITHLVGPIDPINLDAFLVICRLAGIAKNGLQLPTYLPQFMVDLLQPQSPSTSKNLFGPYLNPPNALIETNLAAKDQLQRSDASLPSIFAKPPDSPAESIRQRRRMDTTNSEINNLNSQISDISINVSRVEEDNRRLGEEINLAGLRLSKLQQERTEKENLLKNLQMERNSLNDRILNLNQRINDETRLIEAITSQANPVEAEIEQKKQEENFLLEKVDKIVQEKNMKQKEVPKIRPNIDTTESRKPSLNEPLISFNSNKNSPLNQTNSEVTFFPSESNDTAKSDSAAQSKTEKSVENIFSSPPTSQSLPISPQKQPAKIDWSEFDNIFANPTKSSSELNPTHPNKLPLDDLFGAGPIVSSPAPHDVPGSTGTAAVGPRPTAHLVTSDEVINSSENPVPTSNEEDLNLETFNEKFPPVNIDLNEKNVPNKTPFDDDEFEGLATEGNLRVVGEIE